MMDRPNPEELAAFADGELDAARAAEVAAAVAADPALGREVEAHRALRAKLGAHFAPLAQAPVPERLRSLLKTADEPRPAAEVIDFAAARTRRREEERARAKAARAARRAASQSPANDAGAAAGRRFGTQGGRWVAAFWVVLLAGVTTLGFRPWESRGLPAGYATGQLAGALDSQLVADQPQGAPQRILLSFRDDAGRYCRAYSTASQGGIACRDDTGWKLVGQGAGAQREQGNYRQAGSADAAIMARAQDMAAGPALDAGEEAAAKQAGWH